MKYPFQKIKEHYKELTPKIFEVSNITPKRWVTPYSNHIDWLEMFSPIEEMTWMSIRNFGQAPMYPQYPVDKYFVDFGNPVVKVAIECDGKEWHTNRAEADAKRDRELNEMGWDVYRICGSHCVKIVEEYQDSVGEEYYSLDKVRCIDDYYNKTVSGLVKAIGMFYFNYKGITGEFDLKMAHKCINNRLSVRPDDPF